MMAVGCSKEEPFHGQETSEEGQILKSAIAVDVKADVAVSQKLRTRANVNIDDFTVIFTQDGHTTPTKKFKYSEMPDVVTLPAGDYVCTATYGENRPAEWDSPYFLGRSESFTVNPYEITSYVAPIECRLENIKVTIEFDPVLKSHMSDDSYVEVKVGDNSGLNFTLTETEAGKAGYFMHTAETTLVATFNGKIDGVEAVETKSMKDVAKGNHYKITFKIHDYSNDPTGDSDVSIQVKADVKIIDVERNVEIGDEPLLDDSERPSEEPEKPGPEEPNPPVAKCPVVEAEDPINLDIVNNVTADSHVVLNITSETGLTEFKVNIISEDLAGLVPDVLDLVNPGENMNLLHELGLLAKDKTTLEGEKSVKFDVSGFMEMLLMLGGDKDHIFKLTVSDDGGQVVKELKLHTVE